ncbi:uncharacterized protein LOC128671922 [Plodia interpunctella]|uniref:uncharacterized protein LOC128671922 n=1 Tax=Plodia interpunctella TaxID=58824 RepID=UPI0023679339|nr:uncharacterized protein LOC128671922 [Plodia interpunctella]
MSSNLGKSSSYIVDKRKQYCEENRNDVDEDGFQTSDLDATYTVSYRKRGRCQNQDVVIESNEIPKEITQSACNLQLDSLRRLKDSTRKLLYLIEEIQSKTHSSQSKNVLVSGTPRLLNLVRPIPIASALPSVTDLLGAQSLKQLESQTNALDGIFIQDEDDDCSIYKRLTRKCHCLNRPEYNDFIIHFNEETKFFTNTVGEIIKNMKILKRFLYMHGMYTKRALQFLNEGLSQSTYTEKVEIIQGCAYADICNLFDEYSIAIVLISWPCKYENYGDSITQELSSSFLHKLVQLEEGRRYLNLSTKITDDLKKIIRKRAAKLEYETLETLNIVLNILQPPLCQNVINATYYNKPILEDYLGSRTIKVLGHRKNMTLDEVFSQLEILNNYSTRDKGKSELTNYLPVLMALFKNMLLEYNNSAMNIVITNILNNIVAKKTAKDKENDMDLPKTVVIADTATETIAMKNESNQIPPVKKAQIKKSNKSKSKVGLGLSPNKMRITSNRKISNWEPSVGVINESKKFNHHLRSSIIVVPVEKYE